MYYGGPNKDESLREYWARWALVICKRGILYNLTFPWLLKNTVSSPFLNIFSFHYYYVQKGVKITFSRKAGLSVEPTT